MIVSEKPRIELLNVDCMEYMATVPDKYFDLAIVDPPYGIEKQISVGGGSGTKSQVKFHQLYSENHKKWDVAPDFKYFEELKRVSKNQIIWGGNYFELGRTRGFIVWDKKQMMPNFSRCEFAWTSFDCVSTIAEIPFFGNAKVDISEKIHPTQKPVKLYRWLLENYATCNKCHNSGTIYEDVCGDGGSRMEVDCEYCDCAENGSPKILDTHGGSMSSAIACHQMGFDLTLCELDKDYYEAGVKRFKEQTLQQSLFK